VRRLASPSLEGGLAGQRVTLRPDASKHAIKVLRAKEGDAFELFDGDGFAAEALIALASPKAVQLHLTADARDLRPAFATHLVLGILKPPAMELALRQGVESGMTHLHPVSSARSNGRLAKPDRLQRILWSAAQQCGRADVPEVLDAAPLSAVLQRLHTVDRKRIAHFTDEAPPGAPTGDLAVLVGPEGGFTPEEVEQALAWGAEPLSLGRWILRASTAAPVALCLARSGSVR